jgi:hypothetical protein
MRTLSWRFGLLIGAMWMGEVILGNLGNAFFPSLYPMAPAFAFGAVICTAIAGGVAAFRTGSIGTALRVSVWSGVISGVITLATLVTITAAFHEAMMKDPSNVQEFARTAHRPPSDAEMSYFLYSDALGGGLNHLWIGPLLGLTVGGIGAFIGRVARADLPSIMAL